MKYEELIEYHNKYGTSKEDILRRHNYENIHENVVIAPAWSISTFSEFNYKVDKISDKIYNLELDNAKFTFIEVNNMGAQSIMDYVLPLGVSNCKKLLFIGSAGALNENIKIGDLAIPEFSYLGTSSTRFLNDDLKDDFENKCYPNIEFNNEVMNSINALGFKCHLVKNYSVDTIFAQFAHIDHFESLDVDTIELETATLFKCAEFAKIKTTALFCISDNTITNKSLYSGRSSNDKEKKNNTRKRIIPRIINVLFS